MKVKKFDEFIFEDVGAKYAERRFNIPQKFTEFDKLYRRRYNNIGQEVIYRDKRGVVILKNPGSLESVGPWVRGIIDLKGNFYVEQESLLVHDQIIKIISSLGLVKYNVTTWHVNDPNDPEIGFITVQRKDDGNIVLGESNVWWRDNKKTSVDIFQVYLDKAHKKNPDIIFMNRRNDSHTPWVQGVKNISGSKVSKYNQIKK
jgi:hypothetical protein